MFKYGYSGCGLDDFDKKGEMRLAKLKFLEYFHDKASNFFQKKSNFANILVQPIRDYIGIGHKGYMKTLRLMD